MGIIYSKTTTTNNETAEERIIKEKREMLEKKINDILKGDISTEQILITLEVDMKQTGDALAKLDQIQEMLKKALEENKDIGQQGLGSRLIGLLPIVGAVKVTHQNRMDRAVKVYDQVGRASIMLAQDSLNRVQRLEEKVDSLTNAVSDLTNVLRRNNNSFVSYEENRRQTNQENQR